MNERGEEDAMATATRESDDGKEIRTLIESWAAAARRCDINAIMACYTPDVVAYDAIMALRFKGLDAYRTHWRACLEQVPGGDMIIEVHELATAASGDTGFAHCLSRCGYVDDKGEEQASWMRATVCCRKTPQGWRIAHEHHSAPFDPESGKALSALTP
jgi:uncharacterized protein (TIGR02246 family)